jgi:ABC-type transport system involved in cytochrome c biogenesis permease subunit
LNLISLELGLFLVALVFCALSTIGYLLSLVIKKIALAKISTWILAASFIFLTMNLLLAAINAAGLVNLGLRAFFSFCAWAASGVYLALQFKTKTRLLGAFIAPFILLLGIAAAGQETNKSLLPDNLQSWFAIVHLILVIVGEALFVVASCAGAMFVIQNGLLKHKKLNRMSRLLPPLNDLDRINHICLLWGFPLLTVGIIAGTVFAGFVWKSGWPTDPKIVWTFAVWIIYGFLLHQRLAIGWKGFRMAVVSCAVFILFLLSYIGVRFCFTTLHDFI